MKTGFTRRGVIAAAVAGALVASATGLVAQSGGLTGQYTVEGRNPDGSEYGGFARISDNGGAVQITWEIQDETIKGQGQVDGRVLTVNWGDATPVVYVIMRNGELHGTWSGGTALDLLKPIR